ncbi:ATP-dependent DNA helicase UvrD2, partial [Dermatophilus congolensis]
MFSGDAEGVLRGLDEAQREVAANPLGPMCVLAGAGTGKTRAITHRIAYGVLSGAVVPQRLLAVTFTARAAGELRQRLRGLGVSGVQTRTFHAAALRQLHYFWPRAVGGALPDVLPHKASLVAEVARRLKLPSDRAVVRDLAAEIEWSKVGMLTADTYVSVAERVGRVAPGVDRVMMARVIEEYEQVKAARRVVDFEDVLLLMVGLLLEYPQVVREVREQYRHFVVDEYQDVNVVQQRLLDLWVGDRSDVCVVGDPAQTIYSFTGASAEHLLGFGRRFEGARVVRLERNYRSSPQVVNLANAMLEGQRGVLRSPIRLRAVGESGVVPRVECFADDEAEAVGVAERVVGLLGRGVAARDIAILFRTNSQSEAFERALDGVGVAYLVRGGERFWSRPEVVRAVVLLRGQARSDDGSKALPDVVVDVLGGVGWSPVAPSGRGARRDEWESLAALVELARGVVSVSPGARLRDLVGEIEERMAASHAPSVDGVTLATLHATKGLEWEYVFLVGASEGFLPIAMAEGQEAVEEERRLAYVGVTRARRGLMVSWAAARHAGGRGSRRVSRFFEGVGGVLEGAGGVAPVVGGAGGVVERKPKRPAVCRVCGELLVSPAERKLRRCQGCPASYDEGLFERLQQWRSLVAAAGSVPAYVVFTDATLMAIAEREPRDRGELAGVSGVGARKLSMYADGVLAVLGG